MCMMITLIGRGKFVKEALSTRNNIHGNLKKKKIHRVRHETERDYLSVQEYSQINFEYAVNILLKKVKLSCNGTQRQKASSSHTLRHPVMTWKFTGRRKGIELII